MSIYIPVFECTWMCSFKNNLESDNLQICCPLQVSGVTKQFHTIMHHHPYVSCPCLLIQL